MVDWNRTSGKLGYKLSTNQRNLGAPPNVLFSNSIRMNLRETLHRKPMGFLPWNVRLSSSKWLIPMGYPIDLFKDVWFSLEESHVMEKDRRFANVFDWKWVDAEEHVRSTSTIPSSRKETLTLMSTWTCENISSVLCIPLFRTVSSVNLKWNFNHEAVVEYWFINGETYLVMVECSDTSGFFQLRISVASHVSA